MNRVGRSVEDRSSDRIFAPAAEDADAARFGTDGQG